MVCVFSALEILNGINRGKESNSFRDRYNFSGTKISKPTSPNPAPCQRAAGFQ